MTTHSAYTPQVGAGATARNALHWSALLIGAGFLLIGILGFIPGVTTEFDTMTFAGHESGAMLLGVFQVSVLHNIVHLLFGIAGMAMAKTTQSSILFLIGGGAIYLVLWAYGLIIEHDTTANFVPFNTADQWLHLGLGIGMMVLGLALRPLHTQRPTAQSRIEPTDRPTQR